MKPVCTDADARSVREFSYAPFAGPRGVHRPVNLCRCEEGATCSRVTKDHSKLSRKNRLKLVGGWPFGDKNEGVSRTVSLLWDCCYFNKLTSVFLGRSCYVIVNIKLDCFVSTMSSSDLWCVILWRLGGKGWTVEMLPVEFFQWKYFMNFYSTLFNFYPIWLPKH